MTGPPGPSGTAYRQCPSMLLRRSHRCLSAYLLLLPAKFVERSFEVVDAFPQRVVGGRLLCRKVVVRLLNDVVIGLAKTPRVGHLSISPLLVVPAEVLPLLRRRAPAPVKSVFEMKFEFYGGE